MHNVAMAFGLARFSTSHRHLARCRANDGSRRHAQNGWLSQEALAALLARASTYTLFFVEMFSFDQTMREWDDLEPDSSSGSWTFPAFSSPEGLLEHSQQWVRTDHSYYFLKCHLAEPPTQLALLFLATESYSKRPWTLDFTLHSTWHASLCHFAVQPQTLCPQSDFEAYGYILISWLACCGRKKAPPDWMVATVLPLRLVSLAAFLHSVLLSGYAELTSKLCRLLLLSLCSLCPVLYS